MSDLPDLGDAPRLKQYLSTLPSTTAESAEEMGVKPTTVKGYRERLRDHHDVSLDYERNGNEFVWFLDDDRAGQLRRMSTKAKQSVTREANQFRSDMEAAILRRLKRRDPLRTVPETTPEDEDLVLAFGDLHMGDVVNAGGTEVFNPRIAYGSVVELTRRTLKLRDLMGVMVDIRNIHVAWLGDMVTGETVYDGQAFDIELRMADQLAMAVECLTHQLETFAEHFENVTLTAVPGNHGMDQASYSSHQANQDLNAYRWVADRLHASGVDNVDFRISEGSHYMNRDIRGHRYHLRHGQDEQIHADATARSESDQRGLLHAHEFDVQVRGHYHSERKESVLNTADVETLPSPKPGDEFAERIGRPDCSDYRRLGKLWRVSDKRPMIAETTIDDIDMNLEELEIPTVDDVRARYN
jgi:hypothetical protein